MQTTYIGQRKVVQHAGRIFDMEAAGAVTNAEWAAGILAAPCVTFPNGRQSHEVATEVLDAAEDELMGLQLFTAGA